MRFIATIIAVTVAVLGTAGVAGASGLLVPNGSQQSLEIVSHSVATVIDNQVARTSITQIFRNPTRRTLEATYVFTLPEEAAVSDFAMWTDGVRRPAVVANREQARRIYQQVVNQRKDPGLLEQTGRRTFQMRVFPILPGADQKVELVYDQTLEVENGTCRFVYPLRMENTAASSVRGDFTLDVRIRSVYPIASAYSPSHTVSSIRKGEGEFVVGLEAMNARLDKDFVLYYKPEIKKLGFRTIAQKRGQEDGTFLMLLSPGLGDDSSIQPKDILLLMDTSGSMKGDKIELAKESMRYFVNSLRDGDRFNILTFSNDVRSFRPTFVGFDRTVRADALAFIDSIYAGGGTAIDDALARAIADCAATGGHRPKRVIFVTDGKPTVGERDARAIIKNAMSRNSCNARIFAFGVETNIDGVLLNQLAARTGGSAELVAPGEDLEVKVSELVARYSRPVLSDIKITIDGGGVHDIYPATPPDLFHGGQVKIVGRYHKAGPVLIRVAGTYRGKRIEMVEEFEMPAYAASTSPIERLWAREKISFLLDEIWWHGNAGELEKEIAALSCKHNVLSPYTAMLLLETEADYRRHGLEPPRPTLELLAKLRTEARDHSIDDIRVDRDGLLRDDGSPAHRSVFVADREAKNRISTDLAVNPSTGGGGGSHHGRASAGAKRDEAGAAPAGTSSNFERARGVAGAPASPGPSVGPRTGPASGKSGGASGSGPTTPGARPARENDTQADAGDARLKAERRDRDMAETTGEQFEAKAKKSADALIDIAAEHSAAGDRLARKGAAGSSGATLALAAGDAVTAALAVQAMLASGSTHKTGRYQREVKIDLARLLEMNDPSDQPTRWPDTLEVTLAIARAYGETRSPIYRDAAARRIDQALTILVSKAGSIPEAARGRIAALALLAIHDGYQAGLVDQASWSAATAAVRKIVADRDAATLEHGDWHVRADAAAAAAALALATPDRAAALADRILAVKLDKADTGRLQVAEFARWSATLARLAGRQPADLPALSTADPRLAALWSLAR